MKNLVLRAMRSFDESLTGPEYACNQLVVEMISDEPLTDTNELDVCIYSADYQLTGSDSRKFSSRKTPLKIRFQLVSDSFWDESLYHVFIFRNGYPQWYAALSPENKYEKWSRTRLENIRLHPDQKFFAEQLCNTVWWPKLYEGKFKTLPVQELIRRFRIYTDPAQVLPCLLVDSSRTLLAKAFTFFILSNYFTGSNVDDRFSLSLKELMTGDITWKQLKQKTARKKVIIIEIGDLEINSQKAIILTRAADLIRNRAPQDPVYIFHGKCEYISNLFQECQAFESLFTDETTFHILPPDSEPDSSESLPFETPLPFDDPTNPPSQIRNFNAPCATELELQEMVGLHRVKEDMAEARMMACFLQRRKDLSLDSGTENRHHMLFLGNPGTGKTTVARLVGKMYHYIGVLSSGHTVEVSRTDLVGEYIGQTEKKMKEVIDKARGGVLFIDEAYTLIEKDTYSKDYGKEVIQALLMVLSEPNPDMIIILAGYEDKMRILLQSNPGLKDRFPLRFYFDDYTAEELLEMAHRSLQQRNFILTPEADRQLELLVREASAQRDEYFGNGRWIHNLINQGILKSMARRIMSLPHPDIFSRKLFCTIEACDITSAAQRFQECYPLKLKASARIGFRA